MNAKWFLAALLPIFLLASATAQICNVKAATTHSFTLYGAASQGWGPTATNITSPGPTIVVEQGDTVNMTLISKDGAPHQFWVIYTNGSSTHQTGDPLSDTFTSTVNYSFVATNTVGTYEYRCYIHGRNPMYGYFKVVPTGTIPEFQPLVMLSLLAAGTLIAALVYKRKREGWSTRFPSFLFLSSRLSWAVRLADLNAETGLFTCGSAAKSVFQWSLNSCSML